MAGQDDTSHFDGMSLRLKGNHPMKGLVGEWLSLLKHAEEVKKQLFGQYAREAMNFFDSAHNFMWHQDYAASNQGFLSQDGYGATGLPTFRFTMNRVFEAVALIGPALYHRNPNITVTPFTPPILTPEELGIQVGGGNEAADAYAQQVMEMQAIDRSDDAVRAKLKQYFLNRIQQTSNKKFESRQAIDEAVIKGLGLMETRLFQPAHAKIKFPISSYVSCDDFLQDPDAKYRRDRQWIAIKRTEAVNLVERKFGLPDRTLRGNLQSVQAQNTRLGQAEAGKNKNDSSSYDLIEYWEIYSKNGIGQRLRSYAGKSLKSEIDLSQFGEYCYLAVAQNVPFPLNIPSNMLEGDSESLLARTQWSVPYWSEPYSSGGWPVSELSFFTTPDHAWPVSLIKPAIGELRFINWCMSYLADKVASSCTTYIATLKSAAEEIKQQLVGQNGPFKMLEVSTTGAMGADSINKIVQFLQAPDFSRDIWQMLTEVMEIFDKRVGLTELMYGLSTRQMRSAEEASVKQNNTTVRPDEMASKVEDWASEVALKEMECATFCMDRSDFVPFLGEIGANTFEQKVLLQPMDTTVMQFDYRIEEGSARKPNKNNRIDQLNQLGQVIMPTLQAYAMGGQVEPFNAYISDMAIALDLEPDKYTLKSAPQQPGQEGVQAQQEMQMQMQQAAKEAEQQQRERELQLKIEQTQQEMALKQQQAEQAAELQRAQAIQQMQINQAKFEQDALLKQQQIKQSALVNAHKASVAQQQQNLKEKVAKQRPKAKPKNRSAT